MQIYTTVNLSTASRKLKMILYTLNCKVQIKIRYTHTHTHTHKTHTQKTWPLNVMHLLQLVAMVCEVQSESCVLQMTDQATCYFLTVSVLVLTKFIHSLLDLAFPNLESGEREGGVMRSGR